MSDAKIFISHASRNFRVADDLRARLEDLGMPCWIAPRDIPAGSSYGEQITSAIQGAAALVLILTEEANSSRAVANELEMAFRYQKVIIPVRLNPVEPSSSLAFFVNNTQWVDACHTPLKQRVHEIARIVRAVQAGSDPLPPTPEQRSVLGSLERRIEGLIRYKMLTLIAAFLLIAAVGALAAVSSGKTLWKLQAEQDLIDADPSTYGLVNLAAAADQGPGATDIRLQATAYLNLKDSARSEVTWRAFWSGPGTAAKALDTGALASLRGADAQVVSLAVPEQATRVVFCMTALHPNKATRYTARWGFSVDAKGGQVAVSRSAAPQLVLSAEGDCTP